MKRKSRMLAVAGAMTLCLLSSCGKGAVSLEELEDTSRTVSEKKGFDIPILKEENGLIYIEIFVNGSTGTKALFDTGCNGLALNGNQLDELVRDRSITWDDLRTEGKSSLADGSEILDLGFAVDVKITDTDGNPHIVKTNASFEVDQESWYRYGKLVPNYIAPPLVGTAIFNELAEHSYTIDRENNIIHFE